jgi:GDP-mannose 6-dehydrogenase
MLAEGHRAGRLHATIDVNAGLERCDMVWICVGTPSRPDGGIHLASVETVIRQIGAFLRHARQRPLVAVRSTLFPGTMRNTVVPALEKSSGLTVGADLPVVFHPEFLREGSAVQDFEHPPKIVVGEAHPGAADLLMAVYERIEAPRFRLNLEEAELVKYYDNLFHALKVTFANELGAVARSVGADARRVADVFVADTKLNISPYYLRPGFAFGGSCLPKDLRAVLRHGAEKAIRLPMLQGILESNQAQIETFVSRVCPSARGPSSVPARL